MVDDNNLEEEKKAANLRELFFQNMQTIEEGLLKAKERIADLESVEAQLIRKTAEQALEIDNLREQLAHIRANRL